MLTVLAAQAFSAQAPPLPAVFQGELPAAATAQHSVALKAGDITRGVLELKDASGVMLVSDPSGRSFHKESLFEPGSTDFSFLAETTGEYRIQIVSRGQSTGAYALRYRTRGPDSAAAIVVTPTIRYDSSRITQLKNELEAARPDALGRFWTDAAAVRGAFIEPVRDDAQYVYVTFVWRQRPAFEVHNVRLIRPPLVETADYYLTRLPKSDVWYKTMKVHRTSRFKYGFSPNYIPSEDYFLLVPDPLNSTLADIDRSDWTPPSVFVAPGAPDDTWAATTPVRPGRITTRVFESGLLKARISMAVYTPDGYSDERAQYPLLILFSGPAYNSNDVAAPKIIDNLIAAGKIRPVVVCFVENETSAASGASNLRFNPLFADAMATEVVPWLQRSFAISANAADHIVGGFSIGANAGFYLALRHPEVFGNVLSQDGTAGVGRQLPQMFIDAPATPLRAYMAHSLYNLPDAPPDELATMKDAQASSARLRDVLRAKGSDVTYAEFGGQHDWLYVRSSLPDALMSLLRK
jgi:enterochelin esterase family protein